MLAGDAAVAGVGSSSSSDAQAVGSPGQKVKGRAGGGRSGGVYGGAGFGDFGGYGDDGGDDYVYLQQYKMLMMQQPVQLFA